MRELEQEIMRAIQRFNQRDRESVSRFTIELSIGEGDDVFIYTFAGDLLCIEDFPTFTAIQEEEQCLN